MKKIAILGCENSHANSFLTFIGEREEFSDVEVVGVYSNETEAAKKLNGKFPGRATSISYAQVLEIVDLMNFPDGTHPDEASHTILAERLALILEGYYN